MEKIKLKLVVGSANPVKVQAVSEALRAYPSLKEALVLSYAAESAVAAQPMSFEEILRGAQNRACNAFAAEQGCSYSIGIESGLIAAPGTATGYLEMTLCVIWDGQRFSTGTSCCFELPPRLLQLVLEENKDLSQASHALGLWKDGFLGSGQGLVGVLTQARIDRKAYTQQAVMMALIAVENKDLYS